MSVKKTKNPSRDEQRAARKLAQEQNISYQAALQRVRMGWKNGDPPFTVRINGELRPDNQVLLGAFEDTRTIKGMAEYEGYSEEEVLEWMEKDPTLKAEIAAAKQRFAEEHAPSEAEKNLVSYLEYLFPDLTPALARILAVIADQLVELKIKNPESAELYEKRSIGVLNTIKPGIKNGVIFSGHERDTLFVSLLDGLEACLKEEVGKPQTVESVVKEMANAGPNYGFGASWVAKQLDKPIGEVTPELLKMVQKGDLILRYELVSPFSGRTIKSYAADEALPIDETISGEEMGEEDFIVTQKDILVSYHFPTV